MTSKLVIVIEQLNRRTVNHNKVIDAISLVSQYYSLCILGAKIVATGAECVSHQSVACR